MFDKACEACGYTGKKRSYSLMAEKVLCIDMGACAKRQNRKAAKNSNNAARTV